MLDSENEKESDPSRDSELLADLLEACRDDPDGFNAAVLGRPDYWWRQVEICEAVSRYKTVVIPTGNSIGKSYLAAGLALWWLYTRPDSLVVTTAPSQTLLGTVLFKEIRRAAASSLVDLDATVTESPKVSPQTLSADNTDYQILGIATKGVERFSGQHNPNLLVIVDEASGIDDEIWEAIRSQNPHKQVFFGNPIKAEGEFRRAAKRADEEAGDVSIPDHMRTVCIKIPSTDSPDIHLDRSPRGLADKGFIHEAERVYGRDSLWWLTHIAAEFPDQDFDGLLKQFWVDRMSQVADEVQRLRASGYPGNRRVIAADLGEGTGRDRTVIGVLDKLGIIHCEASDRVGIPEAAVRIDQLRRSHGVRQEHIVFDAGGRGKDLPRYLEQCGITEAVPYHGSGKGGPRFTNKRSMMGWWLRQRLDPERPEKVKPIEYPPDYKPSVFDPPPKPVPPKIQPPFGLPNERPWWPSLNEELKALRYEMDGPKIKLENKEDLAKRLGRSPDIVDMLLMGMSLLGE